MVKFKKLTREDLEWSLNLFKSAILLPSAVEKVLENKPKLQDRINNYMDKKMEKPKFIKGFETLLNSFGFTCAGYKKEKRNKNRTKHHV